MIPLVWEQRKTRNPRRGRNESKHSSAWKEKLESKRTINVKSNYRKLKQSIQHPLRKESDWWLNPCPECHLPGPGGRLPQDPPWMMKSPSATPSNPSSALVYPQASEQKPTLPWSGDENQKSITALFFFLSLGKCFGLHGQGSWHLAVVVNKQEHRSRDPIQ